jgi:hypothetical protein
MNATGLSETSINSNPMTQLHMPSRRESSVTAMWKKKKIYTALMLGLNFQRFQNLNVGYFQNVGGA